MLIPRAALADAAVRLRSGDPDSVRVAAVDVDIDPFDLVRAGSAAFGGAAVLATPDGRTIGGLGIALRSSAGGADRFARLDERLRSLPAGLPALLGFSFAPEGDTDEIWDGFAPAEIVVPRISVVREGGRSRMILVVPAGEHAKGVLTAAGTLRLMPQPRLPEPRNLTVSSVPPLDEWREQVAEAVAAINSGGLDKVVLARTVRVRTGASIPGFDLAALLRDRYPGCRVFGWQAGESVFVGASPELLIRRRAGRFDALPLAGSAPRGADPSRDRALGDLLLASEKDRAEHRWVVQDVARRLAPLADTIDVPPAPRLERLSTVQHLATPITGSGGTRLLDLVAALHPTPAVGGTPTPEALSFIGKVEGVPRGWYSGGIGWLDPDGDGEVALALRCALIRDDEAVVFAGNGIVAASLPEDEVAETRLKLRPLLDLLAAS